MRKSALLFFLIISSCCLRAQVNIEFNAINEYGFNSKEALNLVIVNSNPKPFTVFVNGVITDANMQTVVEFKSSEIFLNAGSNIVTPINTGLADVNYFNHDIAEIENRTGTYPSGNYSICVWLTCVTQDCSEAGKGAAFMERPVCTQIHVENPTQLILASPENEGELEETRPLFTWIPPSPVAGSSNLNYTMILVEIMQGQNKTDALNLNRPLIEMSGILNPSLVFPSDLPELEPGKSYAWQVEAYVGKTSIAKSEQWKFKIKKKIEKKDTFRYARLSTMQTTSFYSVPKSSLLCIAFEGSYTHSELTFSVYDDQNRPVKPIDRTVKTEIFRPGDDSLSLVSFGDNKYIVDLAQLPLEIDRYYNFVVMDGANRKFYLRILAISEN